MTAQQVLEKYGFIIYTHSREILPGEVVECVNGYDWFPDGTKLVIIGELTEAEAAKISAECGVFLEGERFYKAIAE